MVWLRVYRRHGGNPWEEADICHIGVITAPNLILRLIACPRLFRPHVIIRFCYQGLAQSQLFLVSSYWLRRPLFHFRPSARSHKASAAELMYKLDDTIFHKKDSILFELFGGS